MRVLIAPDKFKGSLSASEAAAAMAAGWRDARPDDEADCRPVADGGEGSAEAVCAARAGRWIACRAHDPLGRPITARYALVNTPGDDGQPTAFVECSAASGYLLVRAHERDLPRSSSLGTGELLAHAFAQRGVARIIVGLGGSATNDGGLGLAAALGYDFLDGSGDPLPPYPAALSNLARIIPPSSRPWADCPVTAACDVQNPLLGPRGATHVYGPQKGMRAYQEEDLEAGLRRLADVTATSLAHDFREEPGAGAAGGLGFGLLAFCAARLEPGFGLVARLLALEEAVADADIVLTGEGAADAQSLEGKAPHGVATLARRLGKPVILLAGTVPSMERTALGAHFDAIHALTDSGHPAERCIRDAATVLRQAAAEAASCWSRRSSASR